MLRWILRGLRTGVLTTRYPKHPEPIPPPFRGAPQVNPVQLSPRVCEELEAACPTGAFSYDRAVGALTLDYGKCIFCGLCAQALPSVVHMSTTYELAVRQREDLHTEYALTEVSSHG
jgi:formate hydrogenlyase subunit 6/NADH:ubiquinone oxidoreductase subunit I